MKIRLENLTKKYPEVVAVDHLNLEIEDGELVCLLGPSGCGKSTTLSMISGLEKQTEGTIYFDDRNMNEVEAEDRDIGMVFQDYALYPHMTVQENIAFPLKMCGWKKKDRIAKAKEVAKLMRIEEYLSRKPAKLSGGQQQRVAIARAIVKEPKVLLLDEPLSNLDARLRIELRDEIRKLQKTLGITTIFVTHDQEEALSISDRILLLNQGRTMQYATPRELYMEPANVFTAKFLGNPPINLIRDREELRQIMSQCTIYHCKEKEKEALIGIRPEDLTVDPKGELEGTVISVQTLGKEVYLRFDMEGEELLACSGWEHLISEGDKIRFHVKKLYLF